MSIRIALPIRAVHARRVPHRIPFTLAAAVLGSLLALPALAGRPLATDDAAIVADGACQLELWSEHWRDARAVWANPGCNPFGGTEFALAFAHLHPDGAGRQHLRRWQIKQILRETEAIRPGYAVALGGSRTHRMDQRDGYLYGIATVPLAGEQRVLHLNAGVLRAHADGRHRTRAIWGLAYDVEVSTATRASLEGYGTSGERPRWQLGLRHELLPDHLQLDASVGAAWGRWSDHLFTLGLVLVSPAFLR